MYSPPSISHRLQFWFNHWKSHKANRKRTEEMKNSIYCSLSINRPCPYAYRLKTRIQREKKGRMGKDILQINTNYTLPDRLHQQGKIRTYIRTYIYLHVSVYLRSSFVGQPHIHIHYLLLVIADVGNRFSYYWQLFLSSYWIHGYRISNSEKSLLPTVARFVAISTMQRRKEAERARERRKNERERTPFFLLILKHDCAYGRTEHISQWCRKKWIRSHLAA